MKLFLKLKLYEKNIFTLVSKDINEFSCAKNRYHKLLHYYITKRSLKYCVGFYYAVGNYDDLFQKELKFMIRRNRQLEDDWDCPVCDCFCPSMMTHLLKGAIISNRPDIIDNVLKSGTLLKHIVKKIENIVLKNYIENYRKSRMHREPVCSVCDDFEG